MRLAPGRGQTPEGQLGPSGSSLGLVRTSAGEAAPGQVLLTWAPPVVSGLGRFAAQRRRPGSRPVEHVTEGRSPPGAPPPGPVKRRLARGRAVRGARGRSSLVDGGVTLSSVMATVREKAAALNLSALQSPAQRPPGGSGGRGRAVRSAGWAAAEVRCLPVAGQRATDPAAAPARRFRNFPEPRSRGGTRVRLHSLTRDERG